MKGFRTIVFNLILFLFAAIRVAYPEWVSPETGDVNAFLDKIDASFVSLLAIGNIVLRFITSTPIFKK